MDFSDLSRDKVDSFIRYKLQPSAKPIIYDKNLSTVEKLKILKNHIESTYSVNESRIYSRINDITPYLDRYVKNNYIEIAYLDVGAGEGKITSEVSKYLHLDKSKAWAIDVIPIKSDEYISTTLSTSEFIPFNDTTFNLITVFMAAHHFMNLPKMFSEISRVLKPGGILIIREHDLNTPNNKIFYDFVHAIYATVLGSEDTPENFVNTFYSIYYPAETWINYIISLGFILLEPIKRTNDRFDAFYAVLKRL